MDKQKINWRLESNSPEIEDAIQDSDWTGENYTSVIKIIGRQYAHILPSALLPHVEKLMQILNFKYVAFTTYTDRQDAGFILRIQDKLTIGYWEVKKGALHLRRID